LPVLTPQTGQLLALGAGRAVLSATFIAIVMRAGLLAVACLAVVPDWPALGRNAEGALAAVRDRSHANSTDTILIASPGWTNWSREAGGIDITVLLAIGSNTDEGHDAVFILDLDGNNIEAVYQESKTA
jgi:hypothetical protein